MMGVVEIITYQDLIAVGDSELNRMEFITEAIAKHEDSSLYRMAMIADDYYNHRNPTIMNAQKMIYNMMGRAVPDIYAANNKIPSNFYHYFVTQEVQYLLGNGVSFSGNFDKDKKLGKGFDAAIQKATTKAINASVAFGFWNVDHLEVFGVSKGGTNGTEPVFIPLYDEENGALRAGIRYWRIDENKPLRATIYEENGYTDYIQRNGDPMSVLNEKRPYKVTVRSSDIGSEIVGGENYSALPIIPLWNAGHQSELVGNRETIDAYDLMASALVNNIDDGNLIYWVIKNCGGMTDIDDAKFVERLKTTHVAHANSDGEEGASVDAHKVEAPYEANEAALERLRGQLFDDFMALNVKDVANGAATATQIKAAYEPLNSKTDQLETEVTAFIEKILDIVGIDETPTYTRSLIINQTEEINSVLASAEYLDSQYITEKILNILGDGDKAREVIARMTDEEANRFTGDNE